MSKRWASFGGVLLCAAVAAAGVVDEDLQALLAQKGASDVVSTIVCLSDAVNIAALDQSIESVHMSLQQRHEIVIRTLQEKANRTQAPLIAELKALKAAGQVTTFEAYWITNAIRVDATPAAIRQLAARPDVRDVAVNYPIEPIKPVHGEPAGPGGLDTPEPGLVAINVPQVWAMGIDGTGVLVSTLDTGVNAQHPALHGRWAGYDPNYAGHPGWAWKVASGVPADPNTPSDGNGHGTHTMGTVCGGAPGDQVGVAPGAHWIASNCINQGVSQTLINDVLAAWQWIADPDGNPSTVWDVPSTNSNSWGIGPLFGEPHCYDPGFWAAIDACEAAGVVVLFSAGNEGPGANTLRVPADRATDDYRNVAVAAVDANTSGWPIASFSSRGPTNCTPNGSPATKPNISAPGVHVRSSYGSGYEYLDGTSMASPHINGTVALMRQACPNISVQDIKQIIYQTAHHLGSPGENNDYGWGMVDAYAAVLGALQICGQARFGACCDDVMGTCQDNVAALDCFARHGRFAENTLCANLNPACEAHGACCLASGCISGVSESACVAQGGRFGGGGTTCPQLVYNPGSGGAWEDISGTGTHATAAEVDDGGAAYPIGFTLNFYGTPQTSVGICSNGYLTFGTVYNVYTPAVIPHTTDPTNQIAALWTDLDNRHSLYPDANVQYQTLGTAPNRRMIVQYTNCPAYNQPSIRNTFQIVMYETTNKIEFRYQTIAATGFQAGVENADGSVGTNVTATVQSNASLGLTPAPNGPDPCSFHIGDMNCDGAVNFDDINPFVLALSDPAGYHSAYPNCNIMNGDINGDGLVNFDDINPFVALLTGP